MKIRLAAVTTLALLAVSAEAFACGDKFLIVGRGGAFQRTYISVHPSSLLLLDTKVTARKELQGQLKRAGHRVALISTPDELHQALARAKYDAVLADVADAPRLEQALAEIASGPLLLPVLDGASKEQLNAAAAEYKCVLESRKGPKPRRFLASLDAALESRIKSTPLKCEVKE